MTGSMNASRLGARNGDRSADELAQSRGRDDRIVAHFADATHAKGDVLLGADGAHSSPGRTRVIRGLAMPFALKRFANAKTHASMDDYRVDSEAAS